MDVLTSPRFLKQWQLKVVLSKWGMFNTMTTKNCTYTARRHFWCCQSCILLHFQRWNLIGILILRGILKINKSISSKKPFAWVRANAHLVLNVFSESLEGDTIRNVYEIIDQKKKGKIKRSLKTCPSPPSKKKDLILISTKLLQTIYQQPLCLKIS